MSSWTFKISEPGQEPRELEVRPGMTVGRNKKCSCVLKDDSASSRHIRVLEDGDGLAIEDLGSTNGVRLESGSILVRGSRQRLVEGLRFWLGETEILVREMKPQPPKPARPAAPAAPPPRAPAPEDVEQTLARSPAPGKPRPPGASPPAPPPKAPAPEDVEQTLARSPAPGKPRPPGASPPAPPPKAPAPEDVEQTLARSPIPGKPPGASPAARAPAPPSREAPAAMEEAPTLGGASPFRVGSGLAQPPRPPAPSPAEIEEAPTLGGASPFRVGSAPASPPSASRPEPEMVEEAPTLSGPAPFRPDGARGGSPRAPGPAGDPIEEAPTLGGGMQFAFRVGPEALSPPIQGDAPGGEAPFVLEGGGASPEDGEMTMVSGGAGLRSGAPAPAAPPPRAPSPEPPEPSSPEDADARPVPFEATQASRPSAESQATLEALDPRIVLVLSQFKRVVHIRGPEFVVGRGEEVDLEIVHPTISNRHAIIRFERGGFTIEDAGSKNGTFLDKSQLAENSRHDLRPESHVRFAAADALFIAKDPADPDGSLDQRAAKILVRRRKVTSAQVKSAASAGGHIGERLLLETDLPVADWVGAVREASMSSSPSLLGGKLLPVVLGALAIIIIALLLVWLWR